MWCFIYKWSISQSLNAEQPISKAVEEHISECSVCRSYLDANMDMAGQLAAKGDTVLASVNTGGTVANGGSGYGGSLSADGRYVAFFSAATDLTSGDNNATTDVFIRDLFGGVTELISVAADGGLARGGSSLFPGVSGEGRYVVFESSATNLVPNDVNGVVDVFVRDRQSGLNILVSKHSNGTQGDAHSARARISENGQYVVFESGSSTLADGDTNGDVDIFRHDLASGTTLRVSVNNNGTQNGDGAWSCGISGDGRYVTFTSDGAFVPGDSNALPDVYVRDTVAGTTRRCSVSSSGQQGTGGSRDSSISQDGRYVVFLSDAPNLVAGDTNGKRDAFLRDTQAGRRSPSTLMEVGSTRALGGEISTKQQSASVSVLPTPSSTPNAPPSHIDDIEEEDIFLSVRIVPNVVMGVVMMSRMMMLLRGLLNFRSNNRYD